PLVDCRWPHRRQSGTSNLRLWGSGKAIRRRRIGHGSCKLAPELTKTTSYLAHVYVGFLRDLADRHSPDQLRDDAVERLIDSIGKKHGRNELPEWKICQRIELCLKLWSRTHASRMS